MITGIVVGLVAAALLIAASVRDSHRKQLNPIQNDDLGDQ